MCGIAGGLKLPTDALGRMLGSLAHRGPDSSGTWEGATFSLGMTRLAILDRSDGEQPFRSSCGLITAICNGEIYNWQELRQELETAGHTFQTRCDCEILPAAWLQWGTSLPQKLNGMFAFAIHDQRDNSLFLARDRCGQKPLYYTSSNSFTFASEIKAIRASGYHLTPDPRHLSTWLSLRYLPEPTTLFQGIQTLPAAHWMQVNAQGEKTTTRYWSAPSPLTNNHRLNGKTATQVVDELDHLARSSVELALQSDVPVAVYLSAGVDSSLLAHYIHDLGGDVTTTSIGFGASSDETADAEQFSQSLGLPHAPTQLTPKSLTDLPRVIAQMDRPIGDALILAFDHLASHTASLGCKVALGGEGPDEHFAGYSFQKAIQQSEKLGSLGRSIAATTLASSPPALIDRLAGFPAPLGKEGQAKVVRFLREFNTLSPFQRSTRLHTLFEPSEISQLLNPELFSGQHRHPIENSPSGSNNWETALLLQYEHWLPDWSLIRQDKNTMAHSLEYRAPFLDHRLIDFALPATATFGKKGDKFLWRQLAQRHLPQTVTHRPKQPFYLPLEDESWRKPLLSLAQEILEPSRIREQGLLQEKAIQPLLTAKEFLPLKKLASLVILQLWLDSQS